MPVEKTSKTYHGRIKTSDIVIHVIMFGAALFWLYPYLWMLLASFKKTDTIFTSGIFGGTFTIANYQFLLESAEKMHRPFIKAIGNSLFIAVTVTFGVMLSSIVISYFISKAEFPGRDKFKNFILFQMVFPSFMFIVPLFILMKNLGLVNTYSAVILPSIMSASAIFMISQSFRGTPDDYIEAAKVDGAGTFWIIFKAMAPLNKSIISIVGIYTFQGIWENFMWPLIVIRDFNKMPLSVLLATFNHEYGTYVGEVLAGSVIQCLPVIILFVLFRKAFLEGISLSLK